MLALRLPNDIEKRLTVLARKTGRTKSYYAREAILSTWMTLRTLISPNGACDAGVAG
jgi:predicted transcriptional regulator